MKPTQLFILLLLLPLTGFTQSAWGGDTLFNNSPYFFDLSSGYSYKHNTNDKLRIDIPKFLPNYSIDFGIRFNKNILFMSDFDWINYEREDANSKTIYNLRTTSISFGIIKIHKNEFFSRHFLGYGSNDLYRVEKFEEITPLDTMGITYNYLSNIYDNKNTGFLMYRFDYGFFNNFSGLHMSFDINYMLNKNYLFDNNTSRRLMYKLSLGFNFLAL